MMKLSQNF